MKWKRRWNGKESSSNFTCLVMGRNVSVARRHAQQRRNPKRARSKNITISEGDEKTEASLEVNVKLLCLKIRNLLVFERQVLGSLHYYLLGMLYIKEIFIKF